MKFVYTIQTIVYSYTSSTGFIIVDNVKNSEFMLLKKLIPYPRED